jgi:hypothetical protein
MQKIVLVSILALSIVVPLVAARDPNPQRALRKLGVWMAIGIVVYWLAVLLIYPRFLG